MNEFTAPSRQLPLHRLIARHPVLAAVLLPVAIWGIPEVFLFLLRLILSGLRQQTLSFTTRLLVGEPILALEVAALVFVLGWWSAIGFTRWIAPKSGVLYIFPFIFVVLPSLFILAFGNLHAPPATFLMAAFVCLLIGFVEEGCFRGIMLRMLLPRGIGFSVILSGVLFACLHGINLLSGLPPLYVAGEMILALGLGVLFAALRLRSNSLWPAILLHAVHDFPGLVLQAINPRQAFAASPASLVAVGIYSLLFILYTLFILRPGQLAKLRVTYGLAPQPVPASLPEELSSESSPL